MPDQSSAVIVDTMQPPVPPALFLLPAPSLPIEQPNSTPPPPRCQTR